MGRAQWGTAHGEEPTTMNLADEEVLFQFHGRSMWPLLRPGDLVVVRPVEVSQLRVGDCIAFQTQRDTSVPAVVHRVCELMPKIRTKGDHRPARDDDPVEPQDIAGRVIGRIRFGRRREIAGGWRGRVMALALQALARLDPDRPALLGRCARVLRRIVSIFATQYTTGATQAQFRTESGSLQKRMIVRGAVVAAYDDAHGSWRVEWPYSLWVDSRCLPAPVQLPVD